MQCRSSTISITPVANISCNYLSNARPAQMSLSFTVIHTHIYTHLQREYTLEFAFLGYIHMFGNIPSSLTYYIILAFDLHALY